MLGNALERGMGVTHYADHFGTLCGLEVVLADGSIIRTGGGAFGRCPTWNTHKWGVGPYIEGLFSQSNFGIVVKAGIWLFPEPESYCAFTFDLARDEDFPRLVDAVRELTLAGLLTAGVHIINDICALSVISQYPPGMAERVSRLPDDVLLEQRRRYRRVELELRWRHSRHEGMGEECPAPAQAAAQGHGPADLYHRPDRICRDPGGARDHGLPARYAAAPRSRVALSALDGEARGTDPSGTARPRGHARAAHGIFRAPRLLQIEHEQAGRGPPRPRQHRRDLVRACGADARHRGPTDSGQPPGTLSRAWFRLLRCVIGPEQQDTHRASLHLLFQGECRRNRAGKGPPCQH